MSRTAETITKLKHEHELFLLLIVEQELSPPDAYAKVYPKARPASVETCSSRLLRKAQVQTRKAELEAFKALAVRAATRITADLVTRELRLIAQAATADKQHSAASAAWMGIAKIHGMLVEKHIVDAVVRKPSSQPVGPDTMSELEWMQEYGPTIGVEYSDTIDLQPDDEDK